jgi:hypothetical protein
MIFKGIQLKYVYGITWKIGESELTYQPGLAFGVARSHEMTGYTIGLSPILKYHYQFNNSRFVCSLQNSLLGFVSHTEKNDPYFYSFKASDFFIRPHENMKFGSFNNYDHTKLSIGFIPNIDKIHSFLYEFDYLGIWYNTKYQQLNHNFIWRMML